METKPLLPHVLGEGALFAFSGKDGETNMQSGFVATWGSGTYTLLFHTKRRRVLHMTAAVQTETVFVTGDACQIRSASGTCTVAFAVWHTLIGHNEAGLDIHLAFENKQTADVQTPELQVTRDEDNHDYIALYRTASRFSVSYGSSEQEAVSRAKAGAAWDAEEVAQQRLQWYEAVAQPTHPNHARLHNKCMSVMKVNTMGAEGVFRQMWSTPDRVPHRNMWLWDTVFHSIAMNEVSPAISWQCLKTMLETQQLDGMIPLSATVTGISTGMTQPPILAWGVWENYCKAPELAKLREVLPKLESYLRWDMANRDSNGNGLLEWRIEGDVRCRSGESGLDNSARFDEAVRLDAVDFSTFAALDMQYIAAIAAELGQKQLADEWHERAEQLANRIVTELWDDEDGFFYDRRMDGSLSKVKAVTGFLPLLLKQLPERHTDRLIAMLRDPDEFGAACPVPSLALSEPEWSTDMWRGPTWINMNYLVVQGLRLQGRHDEAHRLADATIALVQRYYEQYGVIFEYFDSRDERPPTKCDRKGPVKERYNIRDKVDSIRDFHWSAALTFCLLRQTYQLS